MIPYPRVLKNSHTPGGQNIITIFSCRYIGCSWRQNSVVLNGGHAFQTRDPDFHLTMFVRFMVVACVTHNPTEVRMKKTFTLLALAGLTLSLLAFAFANVQAKSDGSVRLQTTTTATAGANDNGGNNNGSATPRPGF